MNITDTGERLQLPESLENQLYEFRNRVWRLKTIEAVSTAAFGLVAAFLVMYAIDRLGETPDWVRITLFALAALASVAVPLALYRWVWRNRRLDEIARLLTRKHPHVGDQLLGIIELVRSDSEQARSRALCEAAILQVADDAEKRDFRDAVPNPRHRLWGGLLAAPALAAFLLFVIYPTAAANAWVRLLAPWRNTPRYTFAAVDRLPDKLIVPHGEPFTLTVKLKPSTAARPERGTAQIDGQPLVAATLSNGEYEFHLPPQLAPGRLALRIGDARQRIELVPMLRPELTAVAAHVTLPEYLGRPGREQKDVRGGIISLVKGSRAEFTATASRELETARIDGKPRSPDGAAIRSEAIEVKEDGKLEFVWTDRFGLTGKEPFALNIRGQDDEPPTLVCEGLPRQKVVLDSEVLTFKIRAHDDFGVKHVGIEWRGVDDPTINQPAQGERILAAGGYDKDFVEGSGTFSAKSLEIEPQPLNVRLFVEDYLPGRERVYSPSYLLYVLTAEQHAVWLTEQLSRWHRHSLEVRDRELQLYEANKELRALSPEELDRPESRKRIESQAAAETANGRRLTQLVKAGEDLVLQATRNPEFGVGHLEKWAEMLQILKDISGNRMPSVADLLEEAAQAPQATADAGNKPSRPVAGQVRADAGGNASRSEKKDSEKKPIVPAVVDQESTQQPVDKEGQPKAPSESKPSNPRLTLPVTTLVGQGNDKPKKPAPAEEKMEQVVQEQRDLLAEFEKIAEELNRVLAELEGSTLVKRLKAASRLQNRIAGRMSDFVGETFGRRPGQIEGEPLAVLAEMSEQEAASSRDVSYIMDDMEAYYSRRNFVKFKTVFDEMEKLDVVGSLRQLGDDLKQESGISIAQAEFWSDTLDRWAEDLVDPACCGACPGCKAKGCLPPSVILEVLQILEGEVNLREETRVAEQARPAIPDLAHKAQGIRLAKTQGDLEQRVLKVIARIRELPDAEADFAKELGLLSQVALVMNEAGEILARPETGAPAIAAETEAIELLLQSKRINPKGGGGGGSTPGGGGTGETQDSAIALLGSGANDKEVREDRGISQATGEVESTLPEEFRAGLDEYFNRLEGGGSQ